MPDASGAAVARRVVAGIDQGTTGTRTSLYDEDGRLLASAYQRSRTTHPAPGWDEQDPEELIDAVTGTLAGALAQIDGAELAAVGIANQGESVVAFDRRDGRPLSPAVLWSDRRSAPLVEEVRGSDGQAVLEERSGLPLDPYFSASKLAWLQRNLPAVRAAARAGRLAAGTLDSFFLYRLSRGAAFVTDPSTAARTQLMDLRSRRFDPDCAAVYGLDPAILPEVTPTVTAGVPSTLGAPVTASVCDQPAALAAIGAISAGQLKVTYGTGCFVEANAGAAAPRPGGGLMPIVAWELPGGAATYAVEGGVLTAATAVDWLVSVGLAASVQEVDRLAAAGEPGAVMFLPAFSGLAAPWWRPAATGTFSGLRASTRREDLACAVLEGIAQRVADVLDAVEATQGLPEEVRVDGGLAASEPLLQLQADLIGRPVLVAAEREGTAAGAAGLAAIGAGLLDLEGLAARARFERRVEPATSADRRAERRARWREFVTATAALDAGLR